MFKQTTRIIMVICAIGMLAGITFGAQTTDFSGYNLLVLVDESQYTSDGLAGTAVLVYNPATGMIELDDTLGGGFLSADDPGEMLFWNDTTLAWDHTEQPEMWWDDVNKCLGVGTDSATYTPYALMAIADDGITTTTDEAGIYCLMVKTAGVTNAADDLWAMIYEATLNQNGGVMGQVIGVGGGAALTLGTCNDVVGIAGGTTVSAGTILDDVENVRIVGNYDATAVYTDDIYGINVSQYGEDAMTVGDNWYGIFNTIDTQDGVVTGGLRGYYSVITSESDATAIWGQQNDITKTTGALTGNFYGNQMVMTNTAGNVGGYWTNTDLINIQTAGTVASNWYGLTILNDQNGGTISGSSYGIYINQDFDGTTTGATYGIYIDEASNVDYGVYQDDTAMNHFEGSYESPWVAMALTNGDNDAATLANGQNVKATVTAPDGACNLGGITGGTEGRMITIYISTAGQVCTLENDEVGDANDILTMTGADVVLNTPSVINLIYDSNETTSGAWILVGQVL